MLRPLWAGLPLSLAILSAELQKVFAGDLRSYFEYLRVRGIPQVAKVINDPIWRTIRVESWELAILDSPLIQRLRHIRQLGLAGLVYPSACHSRFEHTIGALYQTQRVIESINRNARAHGVRERLAVQEPVSRGDEVLLRIAAILHDVGHCFLSHLSERALNRLALNNGRISMQETVHDARDYFRSPKAPPVSELLSALIVLLPEFLDVLKLAEMPYWWDKETNLAFSIAKLVVGGRFPDRPFMNEIISGALDADKLDYMSRDCYMAGLTMPIDAERLVEKLCVVNVPARKLADHMEEFGLSPHQTVQVLAVQQGGARAFEDLVISRVLLYDKLYNHQKIRAAEGGVLNALDILRDAHPAFREISTYINLSDAGFLECRWPSAPGTTEAQVQVARRIIEGVRLRTTFVRACAFGPELISDPSGRDQPSEVKRRQAWLGLSRLLNRRASTYSPAFRSQVRERAQSYLRTMSQPGLADELKDAYLVIDLPDVQGIAEKANFFVGDESFGVRLYNEMFRVEKWGEAYENQKITGYVFCPVEYAVAVHLAFRDIVREEFGLSFEPWSWQLTKIRPRDLEDFASGLRDRRIETLPAPAPQELLERSQYLRSTAPKSDLVSRYAPTLDEMGERFRSYQSYTNEEITRQRIAEWLLQFELDEIPLALLVLQHLRCWDRAALTDAFAIALEDLDDQILHAQWIPLGGPTTSSHHLSYLWPDLRKLGGTCPKAILGGAGEMQKHDAIVFYDDNVSSAIQSRTILQQWFGVSREHWLIDEEHVDALPEEKIRVLKSARVQFLFATGRRKGLNDLVEAAKELLGHDKVEGHIVVVDDVCCFRPAGGIFGDKDSADRAREAFQKAGRKALADKREAWGKEKTDDRLLGYGNDGGLNIFYYNVPTSTITALWKSSSVPESAWMGLFPRRSRD